MQATAQGVTNSWTQLSDLKKKNKGFPDSSIGKESVCNAGDPGSIPGLGIEFLDPLEKG